VIPFDRRTGYIWHDGRLVDWPDATLHVLTHGLHYASSVFEGVRVYAGRPFMLAEHVARLAASARILDFEIPYSVEPLCQASLEVVAKAGWADGYLRMNAWRGSEALQTAALQTSVHTSIAAWETPAGYYSAVDAVSAGISLQTAAYRRPSAATAPIKSKAAGNYMIGTVSKNRALRDGFDDALLLDSGGLIAESTGAHLFFIRDGELYTPTTRATIDGITRACVLAIADHLNIGCRVGDLGPDFVATADAAFICGTAVELLPVARIDEHRYPCEGGGLFERLLAEYRELTAGRSPITVRHPDPTSTST
jgi:branched-chain amino acid aminotransferase